MSFESDGLDKVVSLLEAGVLADVVSGLVAPQVVPEVVPEDGEEGVVDLHHAEAHLPAVAVAVRLTISPVKPVHGGVVAVPGPHSGGILAVATLVTILQLMCYLF